MSEFAVNLNLDIEKKNDFEDSVPNKIFRTKFTNIVIATLFQNFTKCAGVH